MATMAKWGKMKWVMKSDKLLPINDDLSIEYSLTKKNKKAKIPISFSYTPATATGANVDKEIKRWKSLVGKSNPLYIGKKRFGPKRLKLLSAKSSDIKVYGTKKIYASIELSFEEKKGKANKNTKKKKGTTSKSKKTTVKKTKSK